MKVEPSKVEVIPRAPPPSNSISGYVRNERDSAPIKDAVITVERWAPLDTSRPPGVIVAPLPVLPDDTPRGETKTAADGSFIISNLPSGKYSVMVTADKRHSFFKTDVNVTDTAATVRDFTLYEYCSISGHVYRAEDGKPMAGVRIAIPWSTFAYGAQTSSDGSYTVSQLPNFSAYVIAEALGYVPKYYDGAAGAYTQASAQKVTTTYGTDTPNIDFVLERGGSITGQIFEPDDVTPAAGARVYYAQTSGVQTPLGYRGDPPIPLPLSIEADSSGKYSLGQLLTGTYELWVINKDSAASSLAQVSVTIGKETRIDFVLAPSGSISGHVYESDGVTPIPNVYVRAYLRVLVGFNPYWTTAAPDGSYLFGKVPPGDYELGTSAGGCAAVTVSGGQNTIQDIIVGK